jgi:hypothetical protein
VATWPIHVVSDPDRPVGATVAVRRGDDLSELSTNWALATADLLSEAAPWRTFRWYRGQKHYSGTYWSSTEAGHVIYESRLELTRLLYADFDGSVRRIVAQPFHLTATVERRTRRHVPDFLLITAQGPIVVDVKPLAKLENPRVRFTLEWTRNLVERRGWRYEIWSEPPTTELANIRFLAGFRNPQLFVDELLDDICQHGPECLTLGDLLDMRVDGPAVLMRGAVFHLLWKQQFAVDLTERLTRSSVLTRRTTS